MESQSLQLIHDYVGQLKVQCAAPQYIDEIIKIIAGQLPPCQLRSSILYMPGNLNNVEAESEYIQLLEHS